MYSKPKIPKIPKISKRIKEYLMMCELVDEEYFVVGKYNSSAPFEEALKNEVLDLLTAYRLKKLSKSEKKFLNKYGNNCEVKIEIK